MSSKADPILKDPILEEAQKTAKDERRQIEKLRSALIKQASLRRLSGQKLIRDVAKSTSTDESTVQEEYWSLLHSGKLRFDKGTVVRST